MAPIPVQNQTSGILLKQPVPIAGATFLMALAIAFGMWRLVDGELQHAARVRFDLRAGQITANLQRELASCESTLRGASGLFAVSPSITGDSWHQYVERLDLDNALPALRALGYATAGPIGESIPEGKFASVTLMQPLLPDAPPLGSNPGDDRTRRTALLHAVNTADMALDVHVAPFDAAVPNGRIDFRLYLPVYTNPVQPSTAQDRRSSLAGFLLAVVDVRRLFDEVTAHERHIDTQVFVGAASTPLYRTDFSDDDAADETPVFRKTDVLHFGGETITVVYTTDERFSGPAEDYTSTALLIAGILGPVLLAWIAFLLARDRSSTSFAAGRAQTQLTLNEARMMGIIRSSMEAIITIDETQRIVIFNPMAEQIFGCSAMDAIGTPLSRFIPERFRADHAQQVDQFGVTGVSERQMGGQRVLFGLRTNGDEFPIEASISQIRDGAGRLFTVMLRDVTGRVKADNALKQSREELRELSANLQNVREEEKTRIARELHDDLGQQLTALKMDLASVEQALDADSVPKSQLLDQMRGMRRLVDATVASVRRIAADLRPVMLDDLGLLPAIEWLANDFTNRYGIDVERRIDPGDGSFTRNGATTLFRIVQEALTNVARHAEATAVTLTIRTEGGCCILRVTDNGRGVSQSDARHEKSFGLLGIRERAHMLGGSVAIDTATGRGFSITVTFPLHAVQQQEAQP